MLVWLIGWLEPLVVDGIAVMSIAPGATPRYVAWWIAMHTSPLGLDESNSGGDGKAIK